MQIDPRVCGFFRECQTSDIISPLIKLVESGSFVMADNGKLRPTIPAIEARTPWIHVISSTSRYCGIWHSVMFDYFNIIPSPCFECWKVVVTPRTLEELFQLLKIQEKLQRPSKCGIEVREHTPKLYGGYFYNDSIEMGQECWKIVRDAMDEISPDIDVILKRACTEFEMTHGPSNQWKLKKGQLKLEEAITDLIEYPENFDMWNQPPITRPRIIQSWIKWAYKNGDKTYLKYTGGVPLYPEVVKYHDLDLSTLEKSEMEIVRPARGSK
jgi:hypothetical protein